MVDFPFGYFSLSTQEIIVKKVLKIIIGYIVLLFGAWAVAVSSWQTLHGEWLWAVLVIVGAVLGWAGFRITRGDRVKQVLKDLVSMLMWWAP